MEAKDPAILLNYIVLITFSLSIQVNAHCTIPAFIRGIYCENESGKINCLDELDFGTKLKCMEHYQSVKAGVEESICLQNDTWSQPDFKCKIACGKTSNKLDKPFHATIYRIVRRNFPVLICNGALISEKHVLTSSECTLNQKDQRLDPEEFLVQLGTPGNSSKYSVKQIYLEPKLDDNGLAILEIDPIELNDSISPVCVPSCSDMDEMALFRDEASGEVALNSEKFSKVSIEMVPECNDINMFCTKGDALCAEQTGAALVTALMESTYFIHGILSNSPRVNTFDEDNKLKCASKQGFKFFKRVFPYKNWIDSVIHDDGNAPENSRIDYATGSETNISRVVIPRPWSPCDMPEEFNNFNLVDHTLDIRNTRVNTIAFVDYLKNNSNEIWKLNFTNVCFTTGFTEKADLPRITDIEMNFVKFLEQPSTFIDQFPFYKEAPWNLSNITKITVDFKLNDGNLFILRQREGQLLVYEYPIANEILEGTKSTEYNWRYLTFANTEIRYDYMPTTLRGLFLTNVTFSNGTLQDVIKSNLEMNILFVDYGKKEGVLDLSHLTNSKLNGLRLSHVHVVDSGNIDGEVSQLQNLKVLYLGKQVKIDDDIVDNFGSIFPKARRFAIQNLGNTTLLSKLYNLKNFTYLIYGGEQQALDMGIGENLKVGNCSTIRQDVGNLLLTAQHLCPFTLEFEKVKDGIKCHSLNQEECKHREKQFFGHIPTDTEKYKPEGF